MSSTSLRSDGCSYQEKLRASIGPGVYALNRPANDCGACAQDVSSDPYLRWQAWGPGFCAPGSAVDDSSELLGLNYKASRCALDQYLPGKGYTTAGGRAPHGVCVAPAGPATDATRNCRRATEPTRLSNPPCTLRGTGWNRWEWLCYDPQDKAIIPFEHQVNYRLIVKDNHKPCLPTPIDATNQVPSAKGAGASAAPYVSEQFQNWSAPAEATLGPWAPSPSWPSCGRLKNLGA
jgi:hypothetical protein